MLSDIGKDKIWGFVLIALGVISLVYKPFDKLGGKLQGAPDRVLTLLLIGLALVIFGIAVKGPPGVKALAAFWIVTP